MFREDVVKILGVAVNTPSGSNSQPWRFEVIKDGKLVVIALPEKEHPVLNYRNRGTWIAHGALIENIKIAASALGYQSSIRTFPEPQNPNVTAHITFTQAAPAEEGSFRIIPKRATNRKPFNIIPLTAEQKQYLAASVREVGEGGEARFIEEREKIRRLAEAIATNEIVTLENKKLHKLFFSEIVWDKEEEAKRKMGLYLKTMELKPPQEMALKLFRRWSVMKILNRIGVARGIAKGNVKGYAKTAAMGAVVVQDNDRDFLTAGRIIERIWLKAAEMGFGFHLITGTMFFWQRIVLGKSKEFSPKHEELIKSEYNVIESIVGAQGKIVAALFRLGKDGEPTARSTKAPPEIRWV